jgi:hypothetical protein
MDIWAGKVIQRAIMKHGAENFEKVILEHFENQDVMYAKEAEVVDDEFLAREDTYNLRRGGFGGFEYIQKNRLNGFNDIQVAKSARKKLNEQLIVRYGSLSNVSRIGGCSTKEKQVGIYDPSKRQEYMRIGREAALSDNAKEKRKATMKAKDFAKGENNPNFGKQWIHNQETYKSIMIYKDDVIPEGWSKGRRIKPNA